MVSLGPYQSAVKRDDLYVSAGEHAMPRMVTVDRSSGRLNLAYQGITEVPLKYVELYGPEVRELDLTCNRIRDFRFLTELPYIETLILDRNDLDSHVKFPKLKNLTTLSINHNNISNLSIFIAAVSKSFPNLKFLSMMNNEAAPSYFNGGSFMQYQDYRHYVISHVKELRVLDDSRVRTEEREEASRVYGQLFRQISKKKQKKDRTSSY